MRAWQLLFIFEIEYACNGEVVSLAPSCSLIVSPSVQPRGVNGVGSGKARNPAEYRLRAPQVREGKAADSLSSSYHVLHTPAS